MIGRTATIIGSTGLIGKHLLELLKSDEYFQTIRLLVRRPVEIKDPKVEAKLVNFQDAESFKLAINGSDVVFCAIGTTNKKVRGDKAAYRNVDYDIPLRAATFCKETGCEKLLLVSSVGANSKSKNFYLRLKGEVEEAISSIQLKSFLVFRPSMLLGQRDESRPVEKVGQVLMKNLSFLITGKYSKYKAIHAKDVAKAMITAAKRNEQGMKIFEYTAIQKLLQY
ncbi:MAG TPA: NAD(P)H-binding protein [Flavisolibacter sp.]|nr:NAD(P)H-binding protein [Flavisolibacter sp.]